MFAKAKPFRPKRDKMKSLSAATRAVVKNRYGKPERASAFKSFPASNDKQAAHEEEAED